jgi:predicted amidohydrolase
MSYVVAVNRIGSDANEYVGHSQVIDMLGEQLVSPTESEGTYIAEEKLNQTRVLNS